MSPDALTTLPVSSVASAGRRAWAALEPLHNYMYFVPAAHRLYAAEGVGDPRNSYYAARGSAVGDVGSEPFVAMYYNFSPFQVRWAYPHVWEQITPERAREVRTDAVEQALGKVLGEARTSPELLEALELARRAAESATEIPQGRPLFAAHAALPWPESPHAQLWHAQTLLREFRGDGHTAVLLNAGVTGLNALVLFTATEKVDGEQLRLSRGWNKTEWSAAQDDLVEQGLLEPGGEFEVTEAGRELRQRIEDTTDRMAEPAYAVLGADGADRLADLSTKLNGPVVAADVIPWLRKRVVRTRRSLVKQR